MVVFQRVSSLVCVDLYKKETVTVYESTLRVYFHTSCNTFIAAMEAINTYS
jgi:hypothetical protein